jgi:hypothetical protein
MPWSPSRLDEFKNCPSSFYEVNVAKSVIKEPFDEQSVGVTDHKHLEDYMSVGTPLPAHLLIHKKYLDKISAKDGQFWTELKCGIDKKLKPCSFFAKDVWCRLVIDYIKIDPQAKVPIAYIVDYKTGKQKENYRQLALYAIWAFAQFEVDLVDARFYWTQTQTDSRKVWSKKEIPELWRMFVGDLKQYAEAFKTNVWQKRQSGLCNGWCPVTKCEHWNPKRPRR